MRERELHFLRTTSLLILTHIFSSAAIYKKKIIIIVIINEKKNLQYDTTSALFPRLRHAELTILALHPFL